jgi:hypothetical protein
MNSYLSSGNIESLFVLENTNDEMLVTAAKVGEHSAFSELWRRHSKGYSAVYIELLAIEKMQKTRSRVHSSMPLST